MDDNDIIELFWQRSEDVFTECVSKYGSYCRTVAKNILYNDGDADECVNDTWFRAWNAIPPARPPRLKAFLAKITRNLALDRYENSYAQKRGCGNINVYPMSRTILVLDIPIKYVLCYSKLAFTHCEDRATLESDPSAQCGLSIVENPKPSRSSYRDWQDKNEPQSNRDKL